ncbi:Hypothetical protein RG540_CH13790 [Neorhizobium galegae bv. orientalis str. HAMBI 540]|jgi:hypothetical protein|uniref:Uncharacterized protein n=1 Tax=Neorhizobium galegae bv. orientalis str. HAMBI 540 TaxID=1028800 RepID=A0A068SNX7_NEOGA|nr:Hypothetical protein RG540_CH13790 [Neorhizobium galegae bv. orientalis str. HAMBI 540]
MSQSFPPIPEVLLTELEKNFPPSYPDLKQSERELWAKAGEGRVVQFLRFQFEEQNKGRLKRSP